MQQYIVVSIEITQTKPQPQPHVEDTVSDSPTVTERTLVDSIEIIPDSEDTIETPSFSGDEIRQKIEDLDFIARLGGKQ